MRRLTLLSGSKLQLAERCVFWAQPGIPHSDVGPSVAREVGTAFHACVENFLTTGDAYFASSLNALSNDQRYEVAALYSSWLSFYWPGQLRGRETRAEVTYAFHAKTREVRILGRSLGRQYEEAGILPDEIPVTVDLVVESRSSVIVYDWKTGSQRGRQPIAEHSQLRAGGFCAARAAGVDTAEIVVAYISDDDVHEFSAVLYQFDFAAVEEELVRLHRETLSNPEPRPGPHCSEMWCPAIASCPATHQAERQLRGGAAFPNSPASVIVPNSAAIRSKQQAAEMYSKLKAIDAMSEACWHALKGYVDANGPVPIGDGREYAAVEKSRDSIRLTDDAVALVRSTLGDHTDKAIKTSISKDAIKAATMAMVGGGKSRVALERKLMLGLEEIGAVSVSNFTTHEAVKAKKTEPA